VVWQIIVGTTFFIVMYYEGGKIIKEGNYWDFIVVISIYLLAFYYTLAFVSGWDIFNPLDGIKIIFEPLGKWLFFKILGL
jgi:hypothetical protein